MFSTTNSSLDRNLLHDLEMKLWSRLAQAFLRGDFSWSLDLYWTSDSIPFKRPNNAKSSGEQIGE
uniref:Uncharacterized protein n=1 Tax=Lepeophtheirus salmonis TaxID=72036 RepID=A0A0K2TGM2_LEPSM